MSDSLEPKKFGRVPRKSITPRADLPLDRAASSRGKAAPGSSGLPGQRPAAVDTRGHRRPGSSEKQTERSGKARSGSMDGPGSTEKRPKLAGQTSAALTDKSRIFAVCAPGLEGCLRTELAKLGIVPAGPNEEGGVEFQGGLKEIYAANLWLRTASRVTVRFAEFLAVGFSELIRKTRNLEWRQFLDPAVPVKLSVTCRSSRLYHSGAVGERIRTAISEKMGTVVFAQPVKDKTTREAGPESEDEEVRGEREEGPIGPNGVEREPTAIPVEDAGKYQLVIVRLHKDICRISVDSSGELLHKRGYRLETARAPLRETLASAMIIASGWDQRSPLIDPFCGSGTIPIEAGLLAAGIPPARHRAFSFTKWREFDLDLWNHILRQADQLRNENRPLIMGSDRDEGAVAIAARNAARAGLAGFVRFEMMPISEIVPPAGSPAGWIVTNPPYGVRVSGNKDLRNLFSRFGQVLRKDFRGWRATVLASDRQMLAHADPGFRGSPVFSSNNGGIRIGCYTMDIPGG